jgi:hypothetical protein
MVKEFDQSFITALLGSSNTQIPQKIASAPIYAMLESLLIGIIILIVIFGILFLIPANKNKMKNNKKLKNNLMAAFVVLIVIVVIFSYITYAAGQGATSFLPFNYFKNSLKSSTSAYVALNGSAATNTSIIACAQTIEGYLKSAGKSVQVIKLTNYSCINGDNISSLGLNCYDSILNSNKPVIFLSQGGQSNITYKGLYGTVLYASGNVTNGQYCTLGSLFRNV